VDPSDDFFSGAAYAVFGARARGRIHGSVLIPALNRAGKCVYAVGSAPLWGAVGASSLAAVGPVDGVVVLPPAPWASDSAELVSDAARQCKEQGVDRLWIYTAGRPDEAVRIAQEHGLDPVAGRCPCLHIVGGGFPHGTHRLLLKLAGAIR
jgi:predicted CoA-binding protein